MHKSRCFPTSISRLFREESNQAEAFSLHIQLPPQKRSSYPLPRIVAEAFSLHIQHPQKRSPYPLPRIVNVTSRHFMQLPWVASRWGNALVFPAFSVLFISDGSKLSRSRSSQISFCQVMITLSPPMIVFITEF